MEQKEEKLFIFSIKETLDSNPTFVPELLGHTKRLSGFPEMLVEETPTKFPANQH